MGKREINWDTRKFADEVCKNFYRDLTDQLFMYIENNKELSDQYENLIAKYKNKDIINQDLGLLFKELFEVDNLERNYAPKSNLIKSFTQHKKQKND